MINRRSTAYITSLDREISPKKLNTMKEKGNKQLQRKGLWVNSLYLIRWNKVIAFFVLLTIGSSLWAQTTTNEFEPNNDVPNANQFERSKTMLGTVGGGDLRDHFRLPLEWHADIYIALKLINNGSNDVTVTLEANHIFFGEPIANQSFTVPSGETKEEFIIICGRAANNYYMFLSNTGDAIDYEIIWYSLSPATARPNNNTRETATPFAMDAPMEGGINYTTYDRPILPNLGAHDRFEYFKTTIPVGPAVERNLYLRIQNNDCGDAGSLATLFNYYLYRNAETAPFSEGVIGGGFRYLQSQSIAVPLNVLQPGDELTIYYRNLNAGAFKFDFSVSEFPPYDDPEDNCCYYNAVELPIGAYAAGDVGGYGFYDGIDTYLDEYDTYKINVPFTGSVQFFVEVQPKECGAEYFGLSAEILDKFGNEVGSISLIQSDYDTECNITLKDTVKLRGWTPGDYFVRLNTKDSRDPYWVLNYRIKYEVLDSTGNNDVEPNNSNTQAIDLIAGDTARGNIWFFQNPKLLNDNSDRYKINITTPGKLVIYSKMIFRDRSEIFHTDYYLNLELSGNIPYSAITPPFAEYLPDDVIIRSDTIDCIAFPGIVYLNATTRFYSPWEYEISYELIPDNSLAGWTNDEEPNTLRSEAILVIPGQTYNGRINYLNEEGTQNDNFDYYKIKFPVAGNLVLNMTAFNSRCDNGIGQVTVTGFRNALTSPLFTAGTGNVIRGDTGYINFTRAVVAGDSITLRISGAGAFHYRFSTGLIAPSPVFTLVGNTTPCLNTYEYKAINVIGQQLTYNWSLPDGGGSLSSNDSIATVTWNETGIRRVSLNISNAIAITPTKSLNVAISGNPPSQTPVVFSFARNMSVTELPQGASCRWFRNGIQIAGAESTSYYASLDGSYTARFANDCGHGPASNINVFTAAAITQTITHDTIPDIILSPTAFVKLNSIASSGLPVFYQRISGKATIQNDTLYIGGSSVQNGNVVISISQPGNDVYSPAPSVFDTIPILKGSQVITFPPIANRVLDAGFFLPLATSSAATFVTVQVVSGNAGISRGGAVVPTGAGPVTLRATQAGTNDYNAASPVERSFCVGVRTLSPIVGDTLPCLATYRYLAQRIPGAIYNWALSNGGTLTTNRDTAWIAWATPGNHTLSVSATSPCDPVVTNVQSLNINTSNNAPGIAGGMQPANNAVDQQLPLKLSWVPTNNTVNYDLYLWQATAAEPATPYAANINDITFTLPLNANLPYNTTYKWKVVAKNPCQQTSGPVQQYSLIPLPDLQVSNVQAPAVATSGQTISISWTVTNVGPGSTLENANWNDGVYIALDTVPFVSFRGSPEWNASAWSSLTASGRPLLLGKKQRPSGLESGQSYTSNLDFKLPLNYSFPVYVYVITDNEHPVWKLLQESVKNDTAKKALPMQINLAPTPDVRVDSVFTPITTFSGTTINVTYRVRNYGVLTPAGSSWSDSIFMSQSPLFDRQLAIPIIIPKPEDTYYPNTRFAGLSINTQLNTDSLYTRSIPVVIPNFIYGTWFVYVKTNAAAKGNILYEGAALDNNIARAQMQIYLTPTPNLIISTLSLPITQASTTQQVGVNWNIRNTGFFDNFEKNHGHNLYAVDYYCPCTSSIPNSFCVGPPVYKDSTTFGSSYWEDNVYLSRSANGLVPSESILLTTYKHGVKRFAGIDFISPWNSCFGIIASRGLNNVATAIKPNGVYPANFNFNLPSDLLEGNYYIYVHTNASKTVFEFPGTPQISRSPLPIVVSRPDIRVSAISSPATATGFQTINIDYSLLNSGNGAVFNHLRKDRLYISNFPTFDGSATLLETKSFTENLSVGLPVTHNFNYKLPAATTGNKYFYVITNFDSSFRETNYANNRSAATATLVAAATPADLIVSSVQTTDSVLTHFAQQIIYAVTNNGLGTTAGIWTDSLFVSCNAIFGRATSFFIGSKKQTRQVASTVTYTDTVTVNIRYGFEELPCFPAQMHSNAYFFVKTNADSATFEAGAVNNNTAGSSVKVLINALVDHEVTSVNAPETASVGSLYPVSWTVKNNGYNPILSGVQYITNYYTGYFDDIYFSTDSIPDINDIQVVSFLKYRIINRGEELRLSQNPILPNMEPGNYYVYAYNNSRNNIRNEKLFSNNIGFLRGSDGRAKLVSVARPPLADLITSIVSAPTQVALGQPIRAVIRVTNNGSGTTFPGNTWRNELILSNDYTFSYNQGDIHLTSSTRIGQLLPGQSYLDTLSANIRITITPGNYILIAASDQNEKIVESNETNNLGFSLVNLFAPPITDLVVSKVTAPDTVLLGYPIDTVKWVVVNTSAEQARGQTTDGIYLSAGSLFDSTAVLLGIKQRVITINPLQADTVRLNPIVTDVVEGNYNLFARADILNNLPESDKANNIGMTTKPVFVKANRLLLNTETFNTLQTLTRYYRLRIPDSLIGATILVTLKTPDSLLVNNEMFIAGSRVPTAASYDYIYETPNYGNQQIVISDATDSVYYIMYRCLTRNAAVQNITLKAVKLPFAILNVQTNAGANIGNVTVRIRGSLFNDSMTAKLVNGGNSITATAIYFTNSTQVFATFPLRGKPMGVYDVVLEKNDGSKAVLENGFSIVPANNGGLITGAGNNRIPGNGSEPGCDPGAESGLNSQLVLDLVVPERVLINRPIVIQVHYSNPTNFDLPVQTRILYSEAGMKMSLNKGDVFEGATALYLEITEPGGPPGIIRAGGSGTIQIYSVSPKLPPPVGYVLFRLK